MENGRREGKKGEKRKTEYEEMNGPEDGHKEKEERKRSALMKTKKENERII